MKKQLALSLLIMNIGLVYAQSNEPIGPEKAFRGSWNQSSFQIKIEPNHYIFEEGLKIKDVNNKVIDLKVDKSITLSGNRGSKFLDFAGGEKAFYTNSLQISGAKERIRSIEVQGCSEQFKICYMPYEIYKR